jgi:predicted nucleic acid-binding protein
MKSGIIMGVLLDTGFLFGIRDKDDPHHQSAMQIIDNFDWNANRPVMTNILVVNEIYTLLNARSKANKSLLRNLDELFWGDDNFFRIYYFDPEDYPKISLILQQYSNINTLLSFVDASIIYQCNLFQFSTVISFDSHFDGILNRICE